MTSGVAAARDADTVVVHLLEGGGVGDGVAVVPDLLPGVDLLAGLTVTGTEVAVVEDESVDACRGEHLGVLVEVLLLDGGVAVGQNDHGGGDTHPRGRVEPTAKCHPFGVELDVATRQCAAPSTSGGEPDVES